MKKIVIASLMLTSILVTSCKNGGASVSKISKENLEKAEQRDQSMKGAAVVSFDREVHDFGTVNEGDVVETSFVVTNTGKSDLIITDAKASCGCTVPTWPKEAIKPGAAANIKVKFNTSGKPNKQSKTVTLTTNTEKGNEQVRITGMVTPKTDK